MNILLFDPPDTWRSLLPLTYTRPVAEIRVGIRTIAGKWEAFFNSRISFLTQPYLEGKYPSFSSDQNLLINGALCPNEGLFQKIKSLREGQSLVKDGILLAHYCSKEALNGIKVGNGFPSGGQQEFTEDVTIIKDVWDIFLNNGRQIRFDFDLITKGRLGQKMSDPFTRIYAPENVFIEEGANIRAAILNAEAGPVYIGKNAQIHEGAIIRGPFALCEGSQVNMGAKIRGDTTVGPYSKVGGEMSNSVIFGFSNKAHEGFLGNSVIGEWCNIGADSNTSNLKNNYAHVKLWNYQKEAYKDTGLQFCGLIMGDHAKCGINTMFNTGTVAGVSANIFGAGYPGTFIPSFSWGGPGGLATFKLDKAFDVARRVMERRGKTLDEQEKHILNYIFKSTSKYRKWENKL